MMIFSNLLKTPVEPPVRIIPNGGLGGLVEFDIGNDRKGSEHHEEDNQQISDSRKKPPPIRVTNLQPPQRVRTAPLSKPEDSFQPLAESPVSMIHAASAVVGPMYDAPLDGVQDLSSRLFWQRSKSTTIPEHHLNEKKSSKASQSNLKSTVVELPGSLPILGRGNTNITKSRPPPGSGRARAYSEKTHVNSSIKQVRSNSPPTDIEGLRAAFHTSQMKKHSLPHAKPSHPAPPATPARSTSPPAYILKNKKLNILNAEDLLRVLPLLNSVIIVQEWIPAMKKEFAKIKSLVQKYETHEVQEINVITAFGDDLNSLLRVSQRIASEYDRVIQEAQAEIDANNQTDFEKLEGIQAQLQHVLSTFTWNYRQNSVQDQECGNLKHCFYDVVRILGGFIRNKLAHTLHNTEEGLTEEAIKILSTFNRDPKNPNRKTPSRTVSTEDHNLLRKLLSESQERYTNAQQLVIEQQELAKSTSKQLDNMLKRLEALNKENKEKSSQITYLNNQIGIRNEQVEECRRQINEQQNIAMLGDPSKINAAANVDIDSVRQHYVEQLELAQQTITNQQLQITQLIEHTQRSRAASPSKQLSSRIEGSENDPSRKNKKSNNDMYPAPLNIDRINKSSAELQIQPLQTPLLSNEDRRSLAADLHSRTTTPERHYNDT